MDTLDIAEKPFKNKIHQRSNDYLKYDTSPYSLTNISNKSILDLTGSEARAFLMEEKSYCNINLPVYFTFDQLLADVSETLGQKKLVDFYSFVVKDTGKRERDDPKNYEEVNHKFINNKDGRYAWRPLQLIHPAIYVSLVNKITREENWQIIKNRFSEFSGNPNIQCISYPLKSTTKNSHKAEMINNWWDKVEQKSITLSLEFQYLFQTDITDCYGSIYTHSIAWAIHGKSEAKKKRQDDKLLGNLIDKDLQAMSHGQTNGIPQGSILMDFIAEIVLGYADLCLSQKLIQKGCKEYQVIRYRDDYRIFTNDFKTGEFIVKLLSETLIELGLKLNTNKTNFSNELVRDSIKNDKLYWLNSFWINYTQKIEAIGLQKHLIIIHMLAERYQNSGSLEVALQGFYKRLWKKKSIIEKNFIPFNFIKYFSYHATKEYESFMLSTKLLTTSYNRIQRQKASIGNITVLISIVTDIAYKNPRVYPIYSSILSILLDFLELKKQQDIIEKIIKRFDLIPNTVYLEVWLQRITYKRQMNIVYNEKLCKAPLIDTEIWNSNWLNDNFKEVISSKKVIDQSKLNNLGPIIEPYEVDLFKSISY